MTFSIVARDTTTGAFGIATATGGPAVGSLVPYVADRTGAIATQGYTTNPFYGLDGLDRLAEGQTAEAVLAALVAADDGRERRQCVMVGQKGPAAAWTGAEVNQSCGSIVEDGVGVAGNLLADSGVLDAMLGKFKSTGGMPLEDRLLAALAAGQGAGGDRRGTRSAALRLHTEERYPAVDLRSDWSDAPVEHLAEILAATREQSYADFFSRLPTGRNAGSS